MATHPHSKPNLAGRHVEVTCRGIAASTETLIGTVLVPQAGSASPHLYLLCRRIRDGPLHLELIHSGSIISIRDLRADDGSMPPVAVPTSAKPATASFSSSQAALVLQHLRDHGLSCQVEASTQQILVFGGMLVISGPVYDSSSCSSANPVLLRRIVKLLRQMVPQEPV